MKASEAPEKIYLATTEEVQSLDSSFVGIAHSDSENIVEPIEYIRKDAFIEKMREFLGERCLIKSKDPLRWISITKVINDFKRYMNE